jgi:hypothetical protein
VWRSYSSDVWKVQSLSITLFNLLSGRTKTDTGKDTKKRIDRFEKIESAEAPAGDATRSDE